MSTSRSLGQWGPATCHTGVKRKKYWEKPRERLANSHYPSNFTFQPYMIFKPVVTYNIVPRKLGGRDVAWEIGNAHGMSFLVEDLWRRDRYCHIVNGAEVSCQFPFVF